MFTYAQLDVLADGYIPLLVVVSICLLVVGLFNVDRKTPYRELIFIFLSIITVYVLMFLDQLLGVWPRFGLDYSTHTALSLVFVVYLAAQSKALLFVAEFSFVGYALLMIYQEYHTLADIISTAVVLLPLLLVLRVKGASWVRT